MSIPSLNGLGPTTVLESGAHMRQEVKTLMAKTRRLEDTARQRGKHIQKLEQQLKTPPALRAILEQYDECKDTDIKYFSFFSDAKGFFEKVGPNEYTGTYEDMWNEGAVAAFKYIHEDTPQTHAAQRIQNGEQLLISPNELVTYAKILDYCLEQAHGRPNAEQMAAEAVLTCMDTIAPWSQPPPRIDR